ncbi:MAG: 4Fe-4S binding protein [Bacteroidaceae bacterium]|nr:4Fe-4S binding protein [Bacteroidaceae bacterium]
MSVVAWAIHRRRSRAAVFTVSIISVIYFGFIRSGCVCSVGSIQNVALALSPLSDAGNTYHLPLVVLLVFILPLLFTLLFGRVFCAGVCPLGALQEIVNIRNFRISRAVTVALSIIPWIYLAFALLYAATRSQFIICRFDPFIGIFRMGGDWGMIVFGVLLLIMSVFIGRPFCQFLCPYGALLGVLANVSWMKIGVTKKQCINCKLCHNSCPVDAIRPPSDSKVGEDRLQGVKRLLMYAVLLPVLTVGVAWLMASGSNTLSMANRDVYLYNMVMQHEIHPDEEMTAEVEAFYEMGRDIGQLHDQVTEIQHYFHIFAMAAGALIGFVLGMKLINLSLKRTRRTYEIDHATCVACGKCFDYCPQNMKTKKHTNTQPHETD